MTLNEMSWGWWSDHLIIDIDVFVYNNRHITKCIERFAYICWMAIGNQFEWLMRMWGCLGDLFAIVKVICMLVYILCMDVWLIVLTKFIGDLLKDLQEMIKSFSDDLCNFNLWIIQTSHRIGHWCIWMIVIF